MKKLNDISIRILDLILCVFALLVFSPVLIIVGFVLLFSGEGDIFYRQLRVGRAGKTFLLLKFATMLRDSSNMGAGDITVKNDPRVLPIGKFLRKTKINEFPQLINIIRGDMSLIGVRPVTPKIYNVYPGKIRDKVFEMPPGLSGVGSIIFRNEESLLNTSTDPISFHTNVISPYKLSLDCWYSENRNIVRYIFLIILTIFAVLSPALSKSITNYLGLPPPPEALKSIL